MMWGNPFQIKKGAVTLVSQQKQNSQGIVQDSQMSTTLSHN